MAEESDRKEVRTGRFSCCTAMRSNICVRPLAMRKALSKTPSDSPQRPSTRPLKGLGAGAMQDALRKGIAAAGRDVAHRDTQGGRTSGQAIEDLLRHFGVPIFHSSLCVILSSTLSFAVQVLYKIIVRVELPVHAYA